MGTSSGDGIELMSEPLRLRLPTEHDAEFVQDMYSCRFSLNLSGEHGADLGHDNSVRRLLSQ